MDNEKRVRKDMVVDQVGQPPMRVRAHAADDLALQSGRGLPPSPGRPAPVSGAPCMQIKETN